MFFYGFAALFGVKTAVHSATAAYLIGEGNLAIGGAFIGFSLLSLVMFTIAIALGFIDSYKGTR